MRSRESLWVKPTRVAGRLLALMPRCKCFYPLFQADRLALREETYVSSSVPEGMDGLRILFLSDIHYGPLFSEKQMNALKNALGHAQADLILLGGDLAETEQETDRLFDQISSLLRAPLGTFAVTGNHDLRWRELDEWNARLDREGIRLLSNAGCRVAAGGGILYLYGTEDFREGEPDFRDADPRGADFSVLMMHNPDYLARMHTSEAMFDLVLCGHTHAGQVVFGKRKRALISSSEYGSRYLYGWMKEYGMDVYVTSGVGTSTLPVRMGTEAEIVCLTLRTGRHGRVTPGTDDRNDPRQA